MVTTVAAALALSGCASSDGPKTTGGTIIGGIGGIAVLTPFMLGLGTITGMFLGGACGSLCVDYFHERRFKPAYRTGHKAFLGKISRIFIKGLLAIIMTIIVLSAIYS